MSANSFNIPRHWWGKIIGAVLGLFRGGISGALIGALLGHIVDRFLAGIVGVGSTQKSFFDALFATLGHLSKADGAVTQDEIRMVETLMQRMQITGEDRQRAIRLFNLGKQADFDLEKTLHVFAQHSVVRQDLRQMFTQILVEAAFSSGSITQAEQEVLFRVARLLRIPGPVFAAMLNARGGAGGYAGRPGAGQRRAGKQIGSLAQAYAHLGLESKATDAEVKKAYRKLVSQYHPDKLVSRGLPEEMMEMAKTRVREINTAYDQIKQARGFI
jgi:DnaJ like chaperone protein